MLGCCFFPKLQAPRVSPKRQKTEAQRCLERWFWKRHWRLGGSFCFLKLPECQSVSLVGLFFSQKTPLSVCVVCFSWRRSLRRKRWQWIRSAMMKSVNTFPSCFHTVFINLWPASCQNYFGINDIWIRLPMFENILKYSGWARTKAGKGLKHCEAMRRTSYLSSVFDLQ